MLQKVRVSETPGKTKHFQTLELTADVTLCDCPGLVMPSLANSKAGMVLQGILPIDQLRDHVAPITHLLAHVPGHVFEAKYELFLRHIILLFPRDNMNFPCVPGTGWCCPGWARVWPA